MNKLEQFAAFIEKKYTLKSREQFFSFFEKEGLCVETFLLTLSYFWKRKSRKIDLPDFIKYTMELFPEEL